MKIEWKWAWGTQQSDGGCTDTERAWKWEKSIKVEDLILCKLGVLE